MDILTGAFRQGSEENLVVFSDEYFDKQWKKQAADDEEVSMLEVFSFPKTKEQMAWKEIKCHADKEGITVFQPDDSHSPHAICYDKTVFLKEQKASNIGIEEQNYQREEKVTDKQAVYSDNTFD